MGSELPAAEDVHTGLPYNQWLVTVLQSRRAAEAPMVAAGTGAPC